MIAKSRFVLLIVLIAAAAILILLFLSREAISKKVYMRAGERLAERMTPEQKAKYGEELKYTLDKFWGFYEKDAVSRNDLTDVMNKMDRLTKKGKLNDMEIFDFIGYVSRIYTDAMRKRHD